MDIAEIRAALNELSEEDLTEIIGEYGQQAPQPISPVPADPNYVTQENYQDTVDTVDNLTESVKQLSADYAEVIKENKRLRDDISHFIRTGVSPQASKPVDPTDSIIDSLF